jgi:hypothetical protein
LSVLPVGFGSAVAGGYQIQRSLRFNSADTAYLNRTPGSAPSNADIGTWSFWVKRTKLATEEYFFGSRDGVNVTLTGIRFLSTDALEFLMFSGGTALARRITTQLFRDVGAWYHFVVVYDSTLATAGDRVKIYVNGVQITAFSTTINPSQNQDLIRWAANGIPNYIGNEGTTLGNYGDYYLTEVNYLDGQFPTTTTRTVNGITETILTQLGEFNSSTGVWTPKAWGGTYGTNGFYVNFSDNSVSPPTATTLGKDYSGNGNNWTPNGLVTAAGAGNDSMVDSPTSYGTDTGVGGTVRGNCCTLNPLNNSPSTNAPIPTNGNLNYETPSGVNTSGWPCVTGTIGTNSGKFYFEVDITLIETDSVIVGGWVTTDFVNDSDNTDQFSKMYGFVIRNDSLNTGLRSLIGGVFTTLDGADATTATYQVAIDFDAGKIWLGKNNTWYSSGNPAAGTGQVGTFTQNLQMTPIVGCQKSNTTGDSAQVLNFGQRAFAYTAPSGFKALCTTNLPTPTIGATSTTQAGKYFNAVIYTGNGVNQASGGQAISGVGFQPDWLWLKSRGTANNHILTDAVRGIGVSLSSDATAAEYNTSDDVLSFNANGFTVASDGTNIVNGLNVNYVAWNWNAGGSNQTISVGQYSTSPNVPSIASTVRANTTAGFSVVTFNAGASGAQSFGHGLGVVPKLVILKDRANAVGWNVYHASACTATNQYLQLNTTAGVATLTGAWGAALPTLNVVGFGSGTIITANANGVAYCFAEVPGYSAFGSYTGNGATVGPFVYTGFRPRFVLTKGTSTSNWAIIDTSISPYNVAPNLLIPNSPGAQTVFSSLDILSNGFKIRNNDSAFNSNGGTYIYAAFAESPFKYSLAR